MIEQRRQPSWRAVGLIVVLALGLRLACAWQTRQVPTARYLVGDALGYYQWAQRIAAGDWVGAQGFYQAPLYPYLLAIAFKIFGEGVWTIRVLQAVWGAAACGCLALGTSWLFHRRAGLVAGWVLALYAPAIYFDGIVQKASLTGLLVCALIAAIAWQVSPLPSGEGLGVRALLARRWLSLAVVGLLIGLLSITRENALIWVPVLAIWAWRLPIANCRLPNESSRIARLQAVGFLVIGLAIVLFPVALRNRVVSGEWSVSTFQAGPNFYIGNHRGADGRYQPLVRGHETPAFEQADAKMLAERDIGHPLTQRQVSRYWLERAWKEIRADWTAWLRLMGLKLLFLVNHYEIADAESFYVYRDSSMLLSVLGRLCHFGTLLPFAVVGLIATWNRRAALWVLHAMIATMILAIAAFFVLGRYRFPIAILLIPFAAAGLVAFYDSRYAEAPGAVRTQRVGLAALIVGLIFAVLGNSPVQSERRLNALAWMNAGVALAQAGELTAAEPYFREALFQHPDSPEAHNNLAQLLALRGEFSEAIEHYRQVLSLHPNLPGVHFNLAVALERAGRPDEALPEYERALQLDPSDAEARAAITRLRGQTP